MHLCGQDELTGSGCYNLKFGMKVHGDVSSTQIGWHDDEHEKHSIDEKHCVSTAHQ